MKPLSETYKELGIAFSFPIEITDSNGTHTYYELSDGYWIRSERDDNGRATYLENSDSYWEKYERDADGRPTYHEDSNGFWQKWERDADGNMDYYEDSTGVKKGTPKSAKAFITLDEEESIRFGEILKAASTPPTPEFKRAIQAYRDSGIELRKDKERLDWLIDNNCEIYEPGTALLYCDCDRESIDEMMNDESETKPEGS